MAAENPRPLGRERKRSGRVMLYGAGSIGLGLNFLLTRPTFNPYYINVRLIGVVFLALGIAKLVPLIVHRADLLLPILTVDIAWLAFWGFGSAITWRQGLSSLQLFVFCFWVAALEAYALFKGDVT